MVVLRNTERNNAIDVIKGIALISVFSAHCCSIIDHNSQFAKIMSLYLQHFGTFGVGCFFIIAGLFYHARNINNKFQYFRLKLYKIGIPWLFSSVCVYLYVHLRKPPLSLADWGHFVIGDGSYLYYLTILFFFYFLYLIPKMYSDKVNALLIFISFFCMSFFYDFFNFSPYLNIFNWIGYFSLGIIVQNNYDKFMIVINKCQKYRYLIYLITFILMAYQILKGISGYYWGLLHVITSFFGIASIFFYGHKNSMNKISFLGKKSLFFYLWHMPIASIVARIFNMNFLIYLMLLRPFIVAFITYLLELFIERYFGDKVKTIFGL